MIIMDEWERNKNINITRAKDFPYREFIEDYSVKISTPKTQYIRVGKLFKCPFCEWRCFSNSFISYGYFEDEVFNHVGEKHECPYNYDSCGYHCSKFRITNKENKCTLKDKINEK